MSAEVYDLTVEAESPITLTRDWMDASTTRDPADQEPAGAVTFPVIPGGYYLSAEGYEDLHIEEVTEDMAVALEPEEDDTDESEDEAGEYESVGAALDELEERIERLESGGGGGGGGGLSRSDVEDIVASALADIDTEGFDSEVVERVRHHAEALDFPARKVGPAEPTGEYHHYAMWGIKFYTGRSCYIRSARVDAEESGTITVRLGETDGVDQFDEVDSVEVDVEEGEQDIDLGLEVPSEGYWMIAVDSTLGLRRGEWNGWDGHMVDNLRLRAGDKPGHEENSYWYKLFDLEMTANPNHEFPD